MENVVSARAQLHPDPQEAQEPIEATELLPLGEKASLCILPVGHWLRTVEWGCKQPHAEGNPLDKGAAVGHRQPKYTAAGGWVQQA